MLSITLIFVKVKILYKGMLTHVKGQRTKRRRRRRRRKKKRRRRRRRTRRTTKTTTTNRRKWREKNQEKYTSKKIRRKRNGVRQYVKGEEYILSWTTQHNYTCAILPSSWWNRAWGWGRRSVCRCRRAASRCGPATNLLLGRYWSLHGHDRCDAGTGRRRRLGRSRSGYDLCQRRGAGDVSGGAGVGGVGSRKV